MSKTEPPPPPPPPPSSRTNLASCIVATIFLLFLFITIFTLYFTLFKPQIPKITITAIQLPSFSFNKINFTNTVNFTFSQYTSVKNPNRVTFSHYDSSFQLLYNGNQIGFMFVPAGKINARRTEFMAATFTVQSLTLDLESIDDPTVGLGPPIEIESRIEMVGRVRVLHLFSHRVKAIVDCWISISIPHGYILGFHC